MRITPTEGALVLSGRQFLRLQTGVSVELADRDAIDALQRGFAKVSPQDALDNLDNLAESITARWAARDKVTEQWLNETREEFESWG